MSVKEYLYSLHGIGLRLTTDSVAIASAVQALLRYFKRETVKGPMAFEFSFRSVHQRTDIPITVSPSARRLFSKTGPAAGDLLRSEWNCDLYREHDRLVADFHDQGVVLIHDCRGQVDGYLVEPEAMHPDIRASFFHFALSELLKRKGLYTIHATALEKGDRGLLISGFSGRGKTTAFLALLRAGYRCLSDDHPLVHENGTRLEILSFPVKIDVTDQTIEFFPELRDAKASLHKGVQKRFFYVEEIYPNASAAACEPAVIIFPRIVDWPKSHLELLAKSRALEELLPHGLLVYDKEATRRQFQTLSNLVEQAACYRLYFGEDVLDLPQLIDPVIERA